jgi:hypothetical protein
MKKLMNKWKSHFNKKMSDQSGQGMLEYILLLVVVVALVLLFKKEVSGAFSDKINDLKTQMGQITQ